MSMGARGIFTFFAGAFVLILALFGCQSSNDVDAPVSEVDGLVELNISPLFKEGEGNFIKGCLWFDENTLILASQKKEEINLETHQSNLGETDIYLYDINKQQATLLPCDYPFSSHWDWNRYIPIRNEEVIGFGEGSAVTFDLDDPTKINMIIKEDDNLRVFSPDLSYMAEVGNFGPDSGHDLQNGAMLLLHNLKTGEVIELDRSLIVVGGGVVATQCYWSFDSATLAYLIDYNRLLIYNVTSGESKRITLEELRGNRDIEIHEFFSLSFTPSGKLLITALHSSGYAQAVMGDNYELMEWTVDETSPSLFIIGESGGRVFSEGKKPSKDDPSGVSGVASYGESPRKEMVFHRDGESFSTGALSPDGKRLAVITHDITGEAGINYEQHLHILPVE
ncbi:hypothetical protein [Dehalobacterium formicoaceticum]|uniref:Uncharacterized protein n=1 Tax=Dehalobacterium formicoaceticum TaxID=51515 RepID=A0ABT1Y4R6_9FIRM|nr:hypothetical protein [Dehalobacterium formicoaceticum]MCR6545869.1 hypothetical protein [Dehalobacterium formicoaceticum]